jgi:hypothetical protein
VRRRKNVVSKVFRRRSSGPDPAPPDDDEGEPEA